MVEGRGRDGPGRGPGARPRRGGAMWSVVRVWRCFVGHQLPPIPAVPSRAPPRGAHADLPPTPQSDRPTRRAPPYPCPPMRPALPHRCNISTIPPLSVPPLMCVVAECTSPTQDGCNPCCVATHTGCTIKESECLKVEEADKEWCQVCERLLLARVAPVARLGAPPRSRCRRRGSCPKYIRGLRSAFRGARDKANGRTSWMFG